VLLTDLSTGATARVRSISADADAVLRLREMGLRGGALVRLDTVAAGGARVVSIGAARLAVDRATAGLIDVEPS